MLWGPLPIGGLLLSTYCELEERGTTQCYLVGHRYVYLSGHLPSRSKKEAPGRWEYCVHMQHKLWATSGPGKAASTELRDPEAPKKSCCSGERCSARSQEEAQHTLQS